MAKTKLTLSAKELLGGIAPSLRVGLPGQYSPQSRGIDMFRGLGGATASFYAKPLGVGVVTDLIVWMMPGTGTASGDSQYLYGLGSAGRIYRIGQTDETVTHLRTIGAYSGTSDGLERYGQSGNMHLFYTHGTNIGRSGTDWTSAAGYNDTYWTTTLGQAALAALNPHPLRAFLTSLYVADGNVLHEINGTAVTLNRLTIPKGQVIVQIEITDTEMVLLTRTVANGAFVGNAKLQFWDGLASRPTHVTDLGESYAPSMLNVGGRIMVLMGAAVKYLADCTSGVQKISTIPASTLAVPGGVSTRNGVLYAFCAGSDNSAKVFSFGSPYPEAQRAIHNPCVTPLGTSAMQSGALMAIDKNNLIGAWHDGVTYQLIRWSSRYAPNCILATITLPADTIREKDWDTFKFYFSQLVADESLKFYYAIDGGSFVPFDSADPSYSDYVQWDDWTAVAWSSKTAVTWADLGLAIAFWQIQQSIHAHELQLAVEFLPSSDYQFCPMFFGLETTYEPIRE